MIKEIKEALQAQRVYANVESVSRSGMSRKVKFYIAHNNRIVDITHYLRVIDKIDSANEVEIMESIHKDRWDYSPIKLGGCGMDVIGYFLDCVCKTFGLNDGQGWYYGKL